MTSTISKVFQSLLNSQILSHHESHRLLPDHQYGFRKARSTGDILFYLTNVCSLFEIDFVEYVVALNIFKDSERVCHQGHTSKLNYLGFSPSLCSFISSFLSGWSVSMDVDGSVSPPFSINNGIPHGSVLSPTLFLFYQRFPFFLK